MNAHDDITFCIVVVFALNYDDGKYALTYDKLRIQSAYKYICTFWHAQPKKTAEFFLNIGHYEIPDNFRNVLSFFSLKITFKNIHYSVIKR